MASERQIGNARLICADCRDVLPSLDGIAAVVADPPYGIGFVQSGRGRGVWAKRHSGPIVGDAEPFDPSPFLGFDDAILWGANYYADKLPPGPGWLVWDKKLGAKVDSFSDGEAAWHMRGTRLRIFRHLWNGLLARERGEKRLHKAQKPIALMEWCVGFVKTPGIILDPFMGSGTTGIACARLGRPFVGIEIVPEYFDLACHRIEQAQRQGELLRGAAA
jgi:DNA modification methylase